MCVRWLLFFTFFIARGAVGVEPVSDDLTKVEGTRISVQAEKDDSGRWRILVEDRNGKDCYVVELPGVQDVQWLSLVDGRILVREVLYGHVDAVSAFDAESGAELFQVLGRRIAVSPDRHWIAYETFFPLHPAESQIWPTMNLLNTAAAKPREMVLFPVGGYVAESENAIMKKWFCQSPILWNSTSSAFVFLARYGYTSGLDGSELHVVVVRCVGTAPEIETSIVDTGLVQSAAQKNRRFWETLTLEIGGESIDILFGGPGGVQLLATMPFSRSSWRGGRANEDISAGFHGMEADKPDD